MKFIATPDEALEFLTADEIGRACLITDPRLPDNPIVYATDEFERRTGYERAELLGRNCRMLQGEDTDPAELARIRQALWDMEPVSAILTNYRKDGSPFRNRFSIRPCFGPAGDLRSFVSVHGVAAVFDAMACHLRRPHSAAALRGVPARPSTGAFAVPPRS